MTTDPAASDCTPEPCLTLTSPADILAAVPYLVGFHPYDSLIVIGLTGGRVQVAVRWSLPFPAGTLAPLPGLLTREGITQLVLVGYGPGEHVTPAVDEARAQAAEAGVPVNEALRAHEGRYWSYTCDLPHCCPADGTPYDAVTSRVAAEATVHGLVALPNRQALERTLAPVTGPARLAMRRATSDTMAEFRAGPAAHGWPTATLTPATHRSATPAIPPMTTVPTAAASDRAAPPGPRAAADAFARHFVAHGLVRVRAALSAHAAGKRLDDAEAARLGLDLTVIRVRDEAWTLMEDSHAGLWKDLMRRLEPPFVPPAATLFAMASWRAGDSTHATIALERALAIDPGYSMALLLMHALQSLLSPSALNGRLPTPAELDAAMGPAHAGWLQPLFAILTPPRPAALRPFRPGSPAPSGSTG